MDIWDVEVPRLWNAWTRVQPVQFEGEAVPKARTVRLCCACARLGDPVQITDGARVVRGSIYQVSYSVLHVRREKPRKGVLPSADH